MENRENAYSGGYQSSQASSTEGIVKSDREIVEIVLSEMYMNTKKDNIVNYTDEAMETAVELSKKSFGEILSEEDAMEKAETVWIELCWSDDNIKNDRPHTTKFYEEYGVWLVDTFTLRSVVNEEGNSAPVPVPGSGYCIIMRKADGKVLAVWMG